MVSWSEGCSSFVRLVTCRGDGVKGLFGEDAQIAGECHGGVGRSRVAKELWAVETCKKGIYDYTMIC